MGAAVKKKPTRQALGKTALHEQGGRTQQPGDQMLNCVQSATIAFLDAYLKHDAAAATYLKSDKLPSYSAGILRIESK